MRRSRRSADDGRLSALADGRIEELPPRFAEFAHPALAHLERALFSDVARRRAAARRRRALLRGRRHARRRSSSSARRSSRSSAPARRRSRSASSARRSTAGARRSRRRSATLGVPYALEATSASTRRRSAGRCSACSAIAWLGGGRARALRVPALAVLGPAAAERRLPRGPAARPRDQRARPGRGGDAGAAHGQPLPVVEELRAAPTPLDAVAGARRARCFAPRTASRRRRSASRRGTTCARYEAVIALLDELEGWIELGGRSRRGDRRRARAADGARSPRREPGRVAVLDLLRARTRSFEIVFVLGLEEGSLPRRGHESPFLDDDARRELDEVGARLVEARPGRARPLPLLHRVHARDASALYLVREAASDEGSPREPSPFWDEVARLFSTRTTCARATTRRPLSALTWPLEGAPTERERLRALALRCAATTAPEADALARANGWERRLDARAARVRPADAADASARARLARRRTSFNVTELERFVRLLVGVVRRAAARSARRSTREVDAKLRGSVAHQALLQVLRGIPKELGVERVDAGRARATRCRSCAAASTRRSTACGMELTELQRRELDQGLWRDLEAFVRAEAGRRARRSSRAGSRCRSAASARAGTQRGLELGDGLTLSGKIDRVDVEPFGARGIVQDYKSGKTAHSAAQIEQEQRLQIPLYMLVLRDLVGIEPLGGLYRAARRRAQGARAAARDAREDGAARATSKQRLPRRGRVLGAGRARARARASARRAHPRRRRAARSAGGSCPTWCDALADVPGEARVNLNAEQQAAVDRATGSSSSRPAPAPARRRVLVERFVARGLRRGRSTSRRSSSSRTRSGPPASCARASARGCVELGRPDLARELDGAWISTIHGFCHRLLHAYPFAAGLDPRFRVLDESQGRGAPRRGVRGGAGRVLRGRRARAAAAARDLRRATGCAGC